MVKYGRKIFPVQGGFLVVRPDMQVYNELVGLVKKGEFDEHKGWGGVVGKFYGSMTIQGRTIGNRACTTVFSCNMSDD